MKNPGDILLLSCYELGHQPLSLASPLAYLQTAGYAPATVDTSVQMLSDEVIQRARLVALSVPMHTALRLGVQVAERVRRVNPSAHITFYGLYAWLNRDYLLPALGDTIIGGEYEEPLLGLARALENSEPVWGVPGVADAAHAAQPYRERLPFALPQRASLPALDQYAQFRDEANTLSLAGYVEATRGCLHTCLHCPITPVYGGRFFVVPREIVLQDIRAQVAAGARHITFGDPDFLNGPGHILRIVRALHDEFPDLTWDATIKIEHILEHQALLPELRHLGCAFIVSAVESFSDPVLAHLAKGHTAADIRQALALTDAAAIPLRASFVAFTPWTTLDNYIEMLQAVERYGLVDQTDAVQYTIRLLIPPGSALLDAPDTQEWLGDLDAAAFTYRWSHPDPRMDDLYRAVSELVEEAVAREEPTSLTFYRIKALAYSYAGQPLTIFPMVPAAPSRVVPGLTEAWFCCAEPTAIQSGSLQQGASCCASAPTAATTDAAGQSSCCAASALIPLEQL